MLFECYSITDVSNLHFSRLQVPKIDVSNAGGRDALAAAAAVCEATAGTLRNLMQGSGSEARKQAVNNAGAAAPLKSLVQAAPSLAARDAADAALKALSAR